MKKYIRVLLISLITVLCLVAIAACDNDNSTDTGSDDAPQEVAIIQLDSPLNLTVENDVLKWDGVSNAINYTVVVDGHPFVAEDNSYSLIGFQIPRNYMIKVRANGDGIIYSNSNYTTPIVHSVSPTPIVITKLDSPQSISIADNILTWNAVSNAVKYIVEIDNNIHSVDTNSFDLLFLDIPSNYAVRVYAKGDEINFIDSDYSITIIHTVQETLSVPSNFKVEGTILTWTEVNGASSYTVDVGGVKHNTSANTFSLASFNTSKVYTVKVAANSDSNIYKDSFYSTEFFYITPLSFELIENDSAYSVSAAYQSIKGDIVIPNYWNGKPVTAIEENGFENCYELINVGIPNTIVNIGEAAFKGCTNLESVTIPTSIKTIETSTFEECSSLTKIIIPNKVMEIESRAFYRCTSLNDILLSENLVSIGNRAFEQCYNLTDLVVPSKVEFLYFEAFKDCISLRNLILPDSLWSIHHWNMQDFDSVFKNCYSLEYEIYGNLKYISNVLIGVIDSDMTIATLKPTTSLICAWAFYECVNLTEIEIPGSVQYIGYAAFASSGLESVTILEGITQNVGDTAFASCVNLTTVFLPNNIKQIDYMAFRNCVKLESISIPTDAMYIGSNAFNGCTSLMEIIIPDSVESISSAAFIGCTNLTKVVLSNQLDKIDYITFASCENLSEVIIPASIEHILENAFLNCTSLTRVFFERSIYNGLPNITTSGNEMLLAATIYWYSEVSPSDTSNNYWHYDVDGVTPIEW